MCLRRIRQRVFCKSEFHFLVVNQLQEMIPNVNTSFISFNIRYRFMTSLVSKTENTVALINLISALTKFKIILISLLELADKFSVKCFITMQYLYNRYMDTLILMSYGTSWYSIRPKTVQATPHQLDYSVREHSGLLLVWNLVSSFNDNNAWICGWAW